MITRARCRILLRVQSTIDLTTAFSKGKMRLPLCVQLQLCHHTQQARPNRSHATQSSARDDNSPRLPLLMGMNAVPSVKHRPWLRTPRASSHNRSRQLPAGRDGDVIGKQRIGQSKFAVERKSSVRGGSPSCNCTQQDSQCHKNKGGRTMLVK